MDKIEGGGSFNVCPDSGAVTRHPESTAVEMVDDVIQANERQAAEAANEAKAARPASKKVVPVVEIKE